MPFCDAAVSPVFGLRVMGDRVSSVAKPQNWSQIMEIAAFWNMMEHIDNQYVLPACRCGPRKDLRVPDLWCIVAYLTRLIITTNQLAATYGE
jgi:hypothetical protein